MPRGYLPTYHVAKPQRQTFVPLPLSPGFYRGISNVSRRLGLGAGTGAALSDAVAELSRIYTRERSQLAARSQGQTVLGARLNFFLARDLPKVFGPLDELAESLRAHEGKRLRVLDLGAGLGATSLGLSRYLKLHDIKIDRLEVTALEHDTQALEVFRRMCTEVQELPDEFVPISLTARAEDLRDAQFGREFDLVLFGFVLNELFCENEARIEKRAQLLKEAATCLRPKGAIVVLEPALKESTRELMAVRDHIVAANTQPFVTAPCLHAQPCPMLKTPRDWCHQELAYALPEPLAAVAEGAGLRFEGLSFASLVLRNEPRAPISAEGTLYRIVSQRLESKGKLELYGCGAPGYVKMTRLDRDQSPQNKAFGDAQRGHILDVVESPERPQRVAPETPVRRVTRGR